MTKQQRARVYRAAADLILLGHEGHRAYLRFMCHAVNDIAPRVTKYVIDDARAVGVPFDSNDVAKPRPHTDPCPGAVPSRVHYLLTMADALEGKL